MGLTIATFAVLFLLIASGGLLLFYREAMLQRISEVINPNPKPKTLLTQFQESGFSIGNVVTHFDSVLPKSQQEVSVVKQRLIRAGYRKDSTVRIFNGCKFVIPITLAAIALVTGLGALSPFFVYAVCLGIGYLCPDSASRPGKARFAAAFPMFSIFSSSASRPVSASIRARCELRKSLPMRSPSFATSCGW